MSVPFVPFGSLYAESVRNGLTRPTAVRGDGYRMVNMGELFAYDRIAEQDMERVQLNERELQVATLEVGDLLFARSSLKAEGTGKCSIVQALPEVTTFESHLIRARLDRAKADPRFYFYFFQSYSGRATVLSIAKQVGAAGLPGSKLAGLAVPQPQPHIQSRIADILSAYDDLFDNNRRRMALLEEAARQLYREWFVRLRFPGHEHTRITNGVPDGWNKVSLQEITTKIGSGFTPRGGESSYLSEGTPLIRSQNVYDDLFVDDGLAFLSDEHAAALEGVSVESKDILLNITGASVARCCMAPERYLPARVNQHVLIVRVDTKRADPFFVHKTINSDERKRQLLSYAQKGSTREALTKEMIARFEVMLPKDSLMRQFGDLAATSFRQREGLALQNQKLRAARDLLLPRLMSGEIAV